MSIIALGFFAGLSLIAAVGAQNAFLLRHAIKGDVPTAPLVVVCILSEVGLLLLGVFGSGWIMGLSPVVMTVITWIGAVFLIAYGSFAAMRAIRGGSALEVSEGAAAQPIRERAVVEPVASPAGAHTSAATTTIRLVTPPSALAKTAARTGASTRTAMIAAIGGMLAFTWLNPHAYLDSVVVLGTLANSHGDTLRWSFAVGAFAAAVVWFNLVGFGGKALRRWFANALAWRVLDGAIAVIMFAIAAMLLAH